MQALRKARIGMGLAGIGAAGTGRTGTTTGITIGVMGMIGIIVIATITGATITATAITIMAIIAAGMLGSSWMSVARFGRPEPVASRIKAATGSSGLLAEFQSAARLMRYSLA
jgi:hypothetical protein